MDVIGKYEVKRDLGPTSSALLKPEVQREILAEVAERLKPMQGELLSVADESAPVLDLTAVVAKTTEIVVQHRSEEHTSELQSLMRISYAVFCLKKKKHNNVCMTSNIDAHTRIPTNK